MGLAETSKRRVGLAQPSADYRNSDQRSVVTHYDSRDHPRTQLSGESKAETPVRTLKEGSAFRKKLAWLFFACSAVVLAVVWPTKVAPALSHFLPKSMLGEQCSRVWIKSNLTQLRNSLDENVFGQHVAVRQVLAALHRRWDNANKADGASPEKPLVFSFHGWTGSGKNYMAKFIAEALFDRGLSSKYVHFLSSTLHFEDHSHRMVSTYQAQLQRWVRGNVTLCPTSLFIIDEVDKLPAGVLDGIGPYMDHHERVDGLDFRNSVFILLSNTGGREITKITMEFWREGKPRESMTSKDLEGLISKGVYNEAGGFHHTSLIDRSLIDHHVPFLPLEKRHVRRCVARELARRGLTYNEQVVDKTMSMLPFWPQDVQVFASSGCKRVVQKLDEVLFED